MNITVFITDSHGAREYDRRGKSAVEHGLIGPALFSAFAVEGLDFSVDADGINVVFVNSRTGNSVNLLRPFCLSVRAVNTGYGALEGGGAN